MQYPTLFIGLGGTGEKVLAQIKTILLDNSPILGPYRFLCIDVDESGRYREERLTKPLESFREFLNIGFYYPTFIEKVCEQDSYFNKWWYDCKEWLFFFNAQVAAVAEAGQVVTRASPWRPNRQRQRPRHPFRGFGRWEVVISRQQLQYESFIGRCPGAWV
jgi:hypothetical protein